MQVTLIYNDPKSLTVEEVVRNARDQYGSAAKVVVGPDSSTPHDHVMHGIQCMITHSQISMLFDKSSNYPVEIKTLRALKALAHVPDGTNIKFPII